MPASDWAKLESNVFDPTILTSVIDGVGTTIDVAKVILEAAKVATNLGVESLVLNPVDEALALVTSSLEQATAAFRLEGALHVLLVPTGERSAGAVMEKISQSMNDLDDLNRPDFEGTEFVAGLVLLGTAEDYVGIAQSAERFATISKNPNRAVAPVRMDMDGSPTYFLRVPQNLIASQFKKGGKPAVRLMWDPERKLGTTVRKVDTPKEKLTIDSVRIVRSETPFTSGLHSTAVFPPTAEVIYTDFAGYDKPNVYVDVVVEAGKTYYYTAAYDYLDDVDNPVPPIHVSNEAWVDITTKPDTPLTYKLPYWMALEGGLEALYPDMVDVMDYITRFIQGYTNVASGRVENSTNLISDFIDSEILRLDGYSAELTNMSSKLAAVFAPWPVGALAAFTFTSGGARADIIGELSAKMLDETDANRPDLDRNWSFVAVLLASSSTAAAAIAAANVLSLLGTGSIPAPTEGLDAAIADLGASISSVGSLIETQFGPDLVETTETIATAPEPTLLDLP